MKSFMNKNKFLAFLMAFTLLTFANSQAFANGSTITRDEHYIYVSTPVQLTFDEVQQQQIKDGTQILLKKLEEINANNPRKTWRDKLTNQLIESAKPFETDLDTIIAFTQKYYASKSSLGFGAADLLPSGFILFSGLEVSGGAVVSGGGSVMLGLVFVPVQIDIYEIDTNKYVRTYLSTDSTFVVWPSANFGIGVGGGSNFRGGIGFIWGELKKASDFKGLVLGGSGTASAGVGLNTKVQILKRDWAEPGAFNNTFITLALETGAVVKAEAHGNLSWIIDAQSFFKSTGSALAVIQQKLGLTTSTPNSTPNPNPK